jgi:transposase
MKKLSVSYDFFIGIDISKKSFDVTLRNKNLKNPICANFSNNNKGFNKLLKWLGAIRDFSIQTSLFCMEHTGIYTRNIVLFLKQLDAHVWLESSLQIKKSLGLNRGKNDKIDSMRIAEYAKRFHDKARLVTYTQINLFKLKDLLTARERLNKSLKIIKVAIKELKKVDKEQGLFIESCQKQAITGLKESIKKLEGQMFETIKMNKKMKDMYDLATSIPGVGKILAIKLMVYTHLFTRFDNTRQLACYCGVAPFEHKSGTSVKGKTRVSKFANMNLKSTLHMAALSAIQHNPEIKAYYNRKVELGKSKMCVINAVRNKLLNRIVAVINRSTPYVKLNHQKFQQVA